MQPDLQELSDVFHRYKNICFYAVNLELKDPDLSEKITQVVMKRIASILSLLQSCGRFQQKALVLLISRYTARQYMKANKIQEADDREFLSKLATPFVLDQAVDNYLQRLDQLSPIDRLVVILRYSYGFNLRDISRVLRIKHKAVTKRLERADSFIFLGKGPDSFPRASSKEIKAQAEEVYYRDSPELKEACRIYLSNYVDTVEAIASIDPHSFDPAFVDETIQKMADGRKQKLGTSWNGFYPGNWNILLLILLVVVVITIAVTHPTENEKKKEKATNDQADLEELVEEDQEEEVKEEKTVESPYYATHDQVVVLIDPDSKEVISTDPSGNTKSWGEIGQVLEDGWGLQHLGFDMEIQKVYLALLNGQGAVIAGDPPELEHRDYWESAWFQEDDPIPDFAKDGLVVNEVRYILK